MGDQLARLVLACAGVPIVGCGGAAPAPSGASNPVAASAAASSVRSIDWMNREYTFGEAEAYRVVNGEFNYGIDENGDEHPATYQPPNPDSYVEHGYFSVSAPEFADLTGDGAEEAILVMHSSTGGTERFTGIEVFSSKAGTGVSIGGIPGGDRGDGGIAGVTVDGATIVVERYLSLEGDGACCPSKLQRERWTWNGSSFVEDEKARIVEDNPDV